MDGPTLRRVLGLAIAITAVVPATAQSRRVLPDLVVTRVAVGGQLAPGARTNASDTTRNAGRRRAPTSRTAYLLSRDRRRSRDDLLLGRRRVQALKPRRSSAGTLSVTVPAGAAPGPAFVLACADASRQVRETSERNNCRASAPATVVAPVFGPITPPVVQPAPPSPSPAPSPQPDPDPDPGPSPDPDPDPGGDPFPKPPLDPPPDPGTVAPAVPAGETTTIAAGSEFLYTGADPIQEEVDPGTIEPKRVAVLRGRVLTSDGQPLPGARVTVLDRPEFGYTATRADGRYDLAVNGGELLVLRIEQRGHATVQRDEDVPWQDYVDVGDVVLTPYDAAVTTIRSDSAAEIQVAEGRSVTDADGSRRSVLMFERGTDAVMELADGSTRPLGDIAVRATEYTVGTGGDSAMPGELPPTSAYTYAVELSVDEAVAAGATDVRFDRPVVNYVDDFLGFPAGTLVPTAYYDRERAAWVPSRNGIVLEVVSETNGLADLDVDSDPEPEPAAELAGFGIDEAERRKLAELYDAPKTLWRVEVTHFTPWDYNWPYGCGGSCPPPDPPPPPPEPCPPCEGGGSVIGFLTQTLGERLPITGTPFALHYASDRQSGYRQSSSLRIPITGDSIPASLQSVELEIAVAGRKFVRDFSRSSLAPGLVHEFTWDGLDAYGRRLEGAHKATIRLGYVYPAVYLEPDRFQASFAQFGGAPVSGNRTRREITVFQEYERFLGTAGTGSDALGGWTLDVHHAYDPQGRGIYLGDGTRRTSELVRSEMRTVTAHIGFARSVAAGADGSIFVAETSRNRVVEIASDGSVTPVAGGGDPDDGLGDGLPATQARLAAPGGIAVAPNGVLYIADTGNGRIRRVATDGTISTVAGGGDPDRLGDDGPALAASLESPRGIALAADGTLYVADAGHDRVRRVTPDGRITTAAGGGSPVDGLGDGGRAVQAALELPTDVAVDGAGTLYVADLLHHRVRAVRADGTISTVAGDGGAGALEEAGAATGRPIGQPHGIDVADDGTLFIADRLHHLVYRVGPTGVAARHAGTGTSGDGGDGNAPQRTSVTAPHDVAIAPDGALIIADAGDSGSIRRAASALPGFLDAELALPSEDGRELHLFSAAGRHTRTVDALTGSSLLVFGYDAAGRLTRITDGDGNVTEIERAADGSPTAIVAPGGQRTALGVGPDGMLTAVTNPARETTRLTYHAGGLLATKSDPGGGAHAYDYDALGRLVRDQAPDGEVQALIRTELPAGRRVSVTTNLGRTTSFSYEVLPDGVQRRTVQYPSGATLTMAFGEDGRQIVTDPDGTVTTTTLGADPRWGMMAPVVSGRTVATPGGLTQTATTSRSAVLGSASDPLSVRSLSEQTTINGRLFSTRIAAVLPPGGSSPTSWTITKRSAVGRESTTTLDARGRIVATRADPAVAPVSISYDPRGRVERVEQGDRSLAYAYDAKHRVVSRTDASGAAVRYAYDDADRVVEWRLPGGRTYGYDYDPDGNLVRLRMPSGSEHVLAATAGDKEDVYTPPGSATGYDRTYDADGMLTLRATPSGATESYVHDSAGRLIGVASPGITDELEYPTGGARDRMSALTRGVAGRPAALDQRLALAFDGPLVTRLDYSGGAAASLSYVYDGDLLPTSERIVSGSATVDTAIEHDGDGLVTREGPFTVVRAGPEGNTTEITDASASPAGTLRMQVAYDSLGRTASRTVRVGGVQRYRLELGYDAVGRVDRRAETIGGGAPITSTFSYDGTGQLLAVEQGGAPVETYAYDLNGNRTTPPATYDAQDRQLALGATAYSFGADGFLTARAGDLFDYAVNGDLLGAVAGGQPITYGYDAFGRRVWRQDAHGTTQYFYGAGDLDAQFRLTATRSPSGELTRFFYDDTGALYAFVRASRRYYVASDQVGSPRLVLDESGSVVKQVDYDAFGRVLGDSAPSFELPVGFAGGIADRATGLVRFGWRDYDPAAGRWTAKDPILFDGSPDNLYAYVGSDPVGARDPSGLNEFAKKQLRKMDNNPKRSQKEYKRLSKEVAGEKSQESAWDLGEKVKDLWRKCTKALGGGDGGGDDGGGDNGPPKGPPPLKQWGNS